MAERKLPSIIPNHQDLLALEPEELAGPILEWLNSTTLEAITLGDLLRHASDEYPDRYQHEIEKAVMESWAWLVREGLVARFPNLMMMECYFISRRGKRIVRADDLKDYCHADLLPRRILHPVIIQKVAALFLRGDYDLAVLQAFKEVEIAVRSAGKFDALDYGTVLMRKAFDVEDGPLTDKSVVKSERQSISDLFSGAIGGYKNPQSHRNIPTGAAKAVELIMLASHLLKIVESRSTPTPLP